MLAALRPREWVSSYWQEVAPLAVAISTALGHCVGNGVQAAFPIVPVATHKVGITTLRLAKHIGLSQAIARQMLKKIRMAMADRDSVYELQNLVEFNDAYVGGKRTGKRGRGAAGKRPVLVVVQTGEEKAGFMAV